MKPTRYWTVAKIRPIFAHSGPHFLACPLYVHLLDTIANDKRLLEIAAETPPGPQPTNLFLAAMHELVLEHPQSALAHWYPSVTDNPQPVSTVGPAFTAFALAHRDEIVAKLQTRLVQTNEVNRCVPLRVALAWLARHLHQPPDYLEIGASAGLLLNFAHYGYRLGDRIAGAPKANLTLAADWRGNSPAPPLDPLPAFHSVSGIDLHPIDPTDPADQDWLRALIWPNQPERRARLDAALAMAKASPPNVRQGDAIAALWALAQDPTTDRPLIVMHAATVAHIPPRVRPDLEGAMAQIRKHRPVWRIAVESGFGLLQRPIQLEHPSDFPVTITDPAGYQHIVAVTDGHATWLRPCP